MADVLSQSEIDALLKQLSSGELDVDEMNDEPAVKIKDYEIVSTLHPSKIPACCWFGWNSSYGETMDFWCSFDA